MAVQLQWKDEYNTGFSEIDGQHLMIVKAINMLIEAIGEHSIEVEMGRVLDLMDSYIQNHFATEEGYFERYGYKNAKEHIAKHREFAEKILIQRKKFQAGESEVSYELVDFLEDWMLDHVLTEDTKYIECFKKNGLK